MQKKKRIALFSVAILLTTIIIVLLIIIFQNNTPRFSEKAAYGDFEGDVVFSENLDYVLTEDFDKYTLNTIEKGVDEYLISLYPSGVGISYVSLNNTSENYSLRIIDSYGVFHTLTIKAEGVNPTIKIDDFEKTYTIEEPNREEED